MLLQRCIAIALSCGFASGFTLQKEASPANKWLDPALEIADWLATVERATEHGITWPVVPAESDAAQPNLYSGSAGVVLFHLELYRSTGTSDFLERALRGADELRAGLPDDAEGIDLGLYTGVAGLGFTFVECWRSSGEERFRLAAERCSELIHSAARDAPQGRTLGDTTDVIAGEAGTGLWLLDSAIRLGRPQDFELAADLGLHLISVAQPKRSGVEWAMSPSFPRRMPNFSHGTAGVAYFLARLYEDSRDERFLEAALKGARTLEDLRALDVKGFRVYHHAPGGETLFYYGWCHGPVGTARLFEVLRRATREPRFDKRLRDCGRAVRASGLPEQRLEGFWDNVSVCCGSAGVASFFVELHEALAEPGDLQFALRVADDLLARATRDEQGMRWIQAEHRTRPELLQAQTGLMQGAAGIGMALLRLDAFERDRDARIRLPDDPF